MDTEMLYYSINEFRETEFPKRKELALSREADIHLAINKAYQDMSPRTIKGHTSVVKDKAFKVLFELIKGFFVNQAPNSQDEFDKKHSQMCDAFLEALNCALLTKNAMTQEFGKAQKIVNMTLKYLYCFQGRQEKEAWFQYAHMPLDTYTLDWYKKEIRKETYVWSNLNKEQYLGIMKNIRDRLQNGLKYDNIVLPQSPLLADFIIWSEQKRKKKLHQLKDDLKKASLDRVFIEKLNRMDKAEIKSAVKTILGGSFD